MRPLTFTTWRNVGAAREEGKIDTRQWEAWVQALSTHARRGPPPDPGDPDAGKKIDYNKAGPCFVPGRVDGSRCNENVRHLDAGILDIDARTEPQILGGLQGISRWAYHVHTTYSHGFRGAVSLRVVVPFARPASPAHYSALNHWLNAQTGGLSDKCVEKTSQPYYFPATWRGNENVGTYNHDAPWLDPAEVLPYLDITSGLEADPEGQVEASDRLARIRARLRRVSNDDDYKPMILRLLRGDALAEKGERHDSYLRLSGILASMTADDPLQDVVVLKLFSRSFAVMRATDPGFDRGEKLLQAYKSAVAKMQAAAKRQAERRRQKALDAQRGGEAGYSPEELQRLAESQETMVVGLKHRWIVQKDTTYWFLRGDGRYVGPYSKEEAPIAVHTVLKRAPMELIWLTDKGQRDVPIRELVKEHGTIPARIVSDLAVQRSKLDSAGTTFYEAACPLRELEPREDPEIDMWLRIFAGDKYGKVRDWLACAPDLDKMLCAVYLCGKKSAGKTLFAYGVGRLWTEGAPTSADEIFGGNFNESLLDCPVIHADESIPKRFNGMKPHELLRSIVSVTSRKIRRKYRATSDAMGALRVILSANNEYLLSCGSMTQDDIEAVAEKVLFVEVPERSAEALRMVPREKREAWAREGIARHALWLREEHYVEPESRFWVAGSMSDTVRNLLTTGDWTSRMCEWCVRYLMNPGPQDAQTYKYVLRQDGKLLVNPQAVIDNWAQYLKERYVEPETSKISSALRSISRAQHEYDVQDSPSGKSWYFEIELENLFAWSRRHHIGSEERMRGTLKTNFPVNTEVSGNLIRVRFRDEEVGTGPARERVPGEDG